MAYGLQIDSALGRKQIDSSQKIPRLIRVGTSSAVSSGTANMFAANLGFDVATEVPLLFIRPSLPEKYVFACLFLTGPDDGFSKVFAHAQCTFDFAIFSTLGTPIQNADTYGLEIYTAAGATVYSSKFQLPQITSLYLKNPSNSGDTFPKTVTLSGYSTMPWILANPLTLDAYSYRFTGSGFDIVSYYETFGVKVNAAFTQLTFNVITVTEGFARTYPFYSITGPYVNQYVTWPAWFGVGKYA